MKYRFVFLILLLIKTGFLFGKSCEYSFDPQATKVQFAAFKFTEKARVEGKFDTFQVMGNPTGSDLKEFGRKVRFQLEIDSLNTGNPERDGKIKKFFFGEMKNTKRLTGYFRNIKIFSDSGQAELILKMNQRERSIPVSITLKEDELQLKGILNVLDWGAQKSLDTLNQECKELHKGSDGVSKLWSEVEISLITQIKKSCK